LAQDGDGRQTGAFAQANLFFCRHFCPALIAMGIIVAKCDVVKWEAAFDQKAPIGMAAKERMERSAASRNQIPLCPKARRDAESAE